MESFLNSVVSSVFTATNLVWIIPAALIIFMVLGFVSSQKKEY